MRWTGQLRRSTELNLGSHGPLDVGGRHGTFLLIDAASWWIEPHTRRPIMEAVTTGVAAPLSREVAVQR